MNLIQLLLPLYDNDRVPIPAALHEAVKKELNERFGGLTAYTRSPAEGHWKTDPEDVRDDMFIYEVMTDALDVAWWQSYRGDLEHRFRQEKVVVRAMPMTLL